MRKAFHVPEAERACTGNKLVFQPIDTEDIRHRPADAVHIAGLFKILTDQRSARDLRQFHDDLFAGFILNIAQINIAEFAGRHFAELLFYTPPAFNGVFQNLPNFLFGHAFIRMNELCQPGEGSADCNRITGIKALVQGKIGTE